MLHFFILSFYIFYDILSVIYSFLLLYTIPKVCYIYSYQQSIYKFDNAFNKGADGAIYQHPTERGLVLMITWSDFFTFIIMLCAVISLVTNNKHKK